MMADMAKAADAGLSQDAKGGQPDGPCKPSVACQASVTVPLPSATMALVIFAIDTPAHDQPNALLLASRPPDRTLRPPINL